MEKCAEPRDILGNFQKQRADEDQNGADGKHDLGVHGKQFPTAFACP